MTNSINELLFIAAHPAEEDAASLKHKLNVHVANEKLE